MYKYSLLFLIINFTNQVINAQYAPTLARFNSGSITPTDINPNITVSNMSFGPGISQTSCTSYLVGSMFNNTTANGANVTGDYFEFTATPDPGYYIHFQHLSILRTGSNLASSTPIINCRIRYKIGNSSWYDIQNSLNTTVLPLGTGICNVDSEAAIFPQTFSTNEPITFRILYYGSSTSIECRIGTLTFFGTATTTLPVKFSHFEVNYANPGYGLKFTTASEINNVGFDIERSSDGIDFQKIGWVDGHGSTTEEKHYTFIDTKPLLGMNYYRLRQVDYDGRFEYSHIVSAEQISDGVYLYPNPASEILHIQNLAEGNYLIKSITGTIVGQGFLKGSNRIDISHIPSGTYLFYPESGRPLIFNKL